MSTFDDELQILLDRHPEILEVKVKYKKGATFRPGKNPTFPLIPLAMPGVVPQTTEAMKVAEMIKNGEL
jgi:hypothetical protein